MRDMNISVLIRLMPATRTGGRLAGQAEIVETGQTFVFAGQAEVIALLDRVAAGTVHPDEAPRDAAGDLDSHDPRLPLEV
jgi:hypothetical protein